MVNQKLNFNINDYKDFRDKIEYFVVKEHPEGILNFEKTKITFKKMKRKF